MCDGCPAPSGWALLVSSHLLPRGGFRLFQVEAHWQREGGEVAAAAKPWVDCRSTGAWEREVEDSIILRAKLLSHRYRDPD
jgi:hypothetical protein